MLKNNKKVMNKSVKKYISKFKNITIVVCINILLLFALIVSYEYQDGVKVFDNYIYGTTKSENKTPSQGTSKKDEKKEEASSSIKDENPSSNDDISLLARLINR